MTKMTWVLIVSAVSLVIAVNVSGVDYSDDWAVAFHAMPWMLVIIPCLAAISYLITKPRELITKMIITATPADVLSAIDNGARLNIRNRRGQTPLMLAAVLSHPEVVAALIDAGADVHATCKQCRTALMYASQTGNTETVSVLLHAGADANAIDPTRSSVAI